MKEGGRGGDDQTRDFEREKGEAGLNKNPQFSIPVHLHGSSRQGGMMGGDEREAGGGEDRKCNKRQRLPSMSDLIACVVSLPPGVSVHCEQLCFNLYYLTNVQNK